MYHLEVKVWMMSDDPKGLVLWCDGVNQGVRHDGFASESLLEPGGSSVETMRYGPSGDFLLSNSREYHGKGDEQGFPTNHLLRCLEWECEAPRYYLLHCRVVLWPTREQVLGYREPEVFSSFSSMTVFNRPFWEGLFS